MVFFVAIFRRTDGAILYEDSFSRGESPSGSPSPSAKSVWALVQVLLPFAREVGGGGVRSVVLRAADTPRVSFGANEVHRRREIAVAHGTLLAVTVTSSENQSAEAKALADRLHKFLITHPKDSDETGEENNQAALPDAFDFHAYMESFVTSDNSSSESSIRTQSSDLSDLENSPRPNPPPVQLVEIDVDALREEIVNAMDAIL